MIEPSTPTTNAQPAVLKREIGVLGATMMGLGSIVGTGVFVSIGIAAGAAGPAVILAIAVAAVVATCNGLSSAQLAANHPVSGGTYEYGYRWLHPSLGFTAGWMFLCAKTASAATAALGFAGYLLQLFDQHAFTGLVPLALTAVLVLTAVVLSGIRHSSNSNVVVVCVTLLSLVFFVLAGLPTAIASAGAHLTPFFAPVSNASQQVAPQTPSGTAGFLQACALMFVAYTGYGRIATLAEEVHEPRRTIPRAIILTLIVSMLLYMSVGFIGVSSVGAAAFASTGAGQAAPLQVVAERFAVPGASQILAVGAVTAMLGVLLNLILGLSRVALAMGRRGDIPSIFAHVSGSAANCYPAVLLVSGLIAGLVLIGDVKTTWSFSAFSVLIYYAITNLAALRMTAEERLYPRVLPWVGLLSCLFLAFWVEPLIWQVGLGLIAGGLLWHWLIQRLHRQTHNT